MDKELKLAEAYLKGKMTRRQMIRAALNAGASLPAIALLVACGQQPTAAPTTAPAAPAPTTAPAAPAPTTAPAAPAARTGGTLTMSYRQAVGDTLNQHISNNTQSRMVARHVLDGLVYVEPSTGEVKPWLATSWEISDDATTYTFKLREDVTFHDGTPFNAEAVKKNFDYTIPWTRTASRGLRSAHWGASITAARKW